MNNKNHIADLIQIMLAAIDNKDWDSLSQLLSDDTIYEVSGFPRFQGKPAVIDYYENNRPIKSGTHTVESIITEADKSVCCGYFEGVKKDGEPVCLYFCR